ncbi:MAG: DUF362 domain-containing protein [Anaerolineae bacterium]|nr:DUF362 domain-containing protein [Anaerolineae bacterium]
MTSKEKHAHAARVLSRRDFLKLGAGGLAALAGGALTGCRLAAPDPAPTYAPIPTAEPQPATQPPPTWTPTPLAPTPLPPDYTPVPATPTSPPVPTTETAPPLSRAALMAHWPETATSRVVLVRHGGVWDGDTPNPAAVLQMLDTGIGALADTPDALAVWRALFDPGERVLLKVNCIAYGGPTQPAVAYAVAQRLQDAGLAAENVLIFDRTDRELGAAGYTLNEGGSGVQCHGTRGDGTGAALSQATVRFYQEFDAYDAIVNIPTPKEHGTAGISVAMKNHYGSINRPGALHGGRCDPGVAELNAQPTIRDKTRLVVGAALKVSPGDWNRPEREDALLLSFDPVALDTVARDILVRHRQDKGMGVDSLIEGAPQLNTAQTLKLGATETELIDLREVVL